MLTLAIETSCDETSVAVVQDGVTVRAMRVASQIRAHRRFGGVVPEIAARMHTEAINPLIRQTMQDAGVDWDQINQIAVTTMPGLEGALLIGVVVAKTLGMIHRIPVVPVHHIKGHIYSVFLDNPTPPEGRYVALVVSGGHTQLWHVKGPDDMVQLANTRDDAAGEAFDKVARRLGLGYPGGPQIEKRATLGRPGRFRFSIPLRRVSDGFSFSGLKTAVSQLVDQLGSITPEDVQDIAYAFQDTVIQSLIEKTRAAIALTGVDTVAVVGGVAANQTLIQSMQAAFPTRIIMAPPLKYCTDNAAMIATAAHFTTITHHQLDQIQVGRL